MVPLQPTMKGSLLLQSYDHKIQQNVILPSPIKSLPPSLSPQSQYIFLYQCLLDGIQSNLQNDHEKLEYTAVYENILALQGYEVTRV